MIDDRRQILRHRDFRELRSAAVSSPACAARAITSVMTDATNSGTPSVRSCNARTNASSPAIDGDRSAT